MSGCQSFRVENFAVGCALAVEFCTVPGGHARFVIIRLFVRIVPNPILLIRIADLVETCSGRTLTAWFSGGGAPGRVAQAATDRASNAAAAADLNAHNN